MNRLDDTPPPAASAATASKKRSTHSPTIENITHDNIESILCLEEAERQRKSPAYRAVERIARFCGTLTFLWLNVALFVAWVAVNTMAWAFDPYPFTFLLFAVSLEAIILSTLILISQNMSAEANERRHHLDLQINLLNEREMTATLRLVTRIAEKLEVDEGYLAEAIRLSRKTHPATVLHQIVEAEHAHGAAP